MLQQPHESDRGSAVSKPIFHCPEAGCPYHRDAVGAKCFKKQLFVDQHVANKHKDKEFQCALCGKRYAFAWQLKHHREVCSKIWSCLSCDKTYSERLSLVVHCKRHRHLLPEEARGWCDRKKRTTSGGSNSTVSIVLLPILIPVQQVTSAQERVILPKVPNPPAPCHSVSTQTALAETTLQKEPGTRKRKSESQASTQTEKKKRSASAQCAPIRSWTSKRKKDHRVTESTETQTLESILSSVGIANNSESSGLLSKKTASTNVGPSRKNISVGVTASSSWQMSRSPEVCGAACVAETSVQTEDRRSILSNCSTIETQTCSPEAVSFSNPLDPDDFFLELDLNDIETQTIWNSDEMTQTDGVLDDLMRGFDLLSDADQNGIHVPSEHTTVETETQTLTETAWSEWT